MRHAVAWPYATCVGHHSVLIPVCLAASSELPIPVRICARNPAVVLPTTSAPVPTKRSRTTDSASRMNVGRSYANLNR